jgi:hypothetical protein
MKILAIETLKNDENFNEIESGLTVFFEFTNEKYKWLLKNLKQGAFQDMSDFYGFCHRNCENNWNTDLFESDDELSLDYTAKELTTKKTLSILQ